MTLNAKAEKPVRDVEDRYTYRRLARAVVHLAIRDYLYGHPKDRRSAAQFLFYDPEWRDWWSTVAGLDPVRIQRQVKALETAPAESYKALERYLLSTKA